MPNKEVPDRGERRVYVRANGEALLRVTAGSPHRWVVIDGVPFERADHACDDDEDGPNAIVYVERPAALYLSERLRLIENIAYSASTLEHMPETVRPSWRRVEGKEQKK